MPPPEVWGPATWTLFHVLAENVNEHIYPRIAGQLFDVIKRICSALPCPECSQDATHYLAKVKLHELKSKNDFKNFIYVFHNYVNVKKRKPLFKYINLEVYKRYNIVSVFNRFISCYHTKGNMRLLTESFQRQFIVRNIREWFSRNLGFFISTPVPSVPSVDPDLNETKEVSNIDNETPFLSPLDVLNVQEVVVTEVAEPVVEEPVIEEPIVEEPVVEEPVVEEPVVLSEATVPAVEPVVLELVVVEEAQVEEPVVEEAQVEEPVVEEEEPEVEAQEEEEEVTLPAVETKPKRGRKKKTV